MVEFCYVHRFKGIRNGNRTFDIRSIHRLLVQQRCRDIGPCSTDIPREASISWNRCHMKHVELNTQKIHRSQIKRRNVPRFLHFDLQFRELRRFWHEYIAENDAFLANGPWKQKWTHESGTRCLLHKLVAIGELILLVIQFEGEVFIGTDNRWKLNSRFLLVGHVIHEEHASGVLRIEHICFVGNVPSYFHHVICIEQLQVGFRRWIQMKFQESTVFDFFISEAIRNRSVCCHPRKKAVRTFDSQSDACFLKSIHGE